MVELAEDVQRLHPRPPGSAAFTDGVVDVTEAAEAGSFAADKPIAMHWNGTAWSLTTVPNQGGGGQLAAVTASSPASVWAAGAADGTSVLHWNGTSWTPEAVPSGPDGPRIMTGISAVRGSATEVWGAAGTFVVHHP